MFVCAFNRFLCFRVKSFFYDVKYRRFFGFVILSEDLNDLGGLLKNAFNSALLLLLKDSLLLSTSSPSIPQRELAIHAAAKINSLPQAPLNCTCSMQWASCRNPARRNSRAAALFSASVVATTRCLLSVPKRYSSTASNASAASPWCWCAESRVIPNSTCWLQSRKWIPQSPITVLLSCSVSASYHQVQGVLGVTCCICAISCAASAGP